MILTAISTLIGVAALLAGLFLLMFNDLGKPTWTAASFVLMIAGVWLVRRSKR